jgi:hypothetical protein
VAQVRVVNEAQAGRITEIGAASLWRIPDGSWLAVRRNERGTWLEVVDPDATVLLAFDFATDEPLRSDLPEHGVAA